MAETVDARGLSCPQPIMETMKAMAKVGAGTIEVLLDSEASEENVTRAATSQGWSVVSVSDEGDHHKLTINKA